MSESNKSATDLPPLKRYITTHLPDGRSVYTPFKAQSGWSHPGVGKVYRSYAVGSVPVVLKGDADIVAFESPNGAASGSKNDIVVKPNGANVAVVDLSPGGMSTMHQTVSIDFSICVVGTIDHELDSGEVVRLKPGVSGSPTILLIYSNLSS